MTRLRSVFCLLFAVTCAMACSCYCPCEAALVGPPGPTGPRGLTGPAGPPPSELTFLAPLSESGNNVSIAEDVYVLTDATPQTVAGTKRFDRFQIQPNLPYDYVLNLFESKSFALNVSPDVQYISPTDAVVAVTGGGWCEATVTVIWEAEEQRNMCCYSASVCVAPVIPEGDSSILVSASSTLIWSTAAINPFEFTWGLYLNGSGNESVVLEMTSTTAASVSSSVRLTYTRVSYIG